MLAQTLIGQIILANGGLLWTMIMTGICWFVQS